MLTSIFIRCITMDLTRKQSTNIEAAGKEIGKGPMNTFVNVPEYPPADFKGVVRPNFDTLYSIAWLRPEQGADDRVRAGHKRALLSPADARHVDGRIRLAWFGEPPARRRANFIIAPPGWRPGLRERFMTELRLPEDIKWIEATTPYVWIIGRTKTDGPAGLRRSP